PAPAAKPAPAKPAPAKPAPAAKPAAPAAKTTAAPAVAPAARPQCKGVKADGSQCGSRIVVADGLCKDHAGQAKPATAAKVAPAPGWRGRAVGPLCHNSVPPAGPRLA